MIRNLKGIGLALIAVFALTALVSSAAQAEVTFTAGANPAVLTGEQIKTSEHTDHTFTVGSRVITCESAIFEGTSATPAKSLTIEPTYSLCTATGGLPATVTMNECDYVFNQPVFNAGAGDYTGTVNLKCPAGKRVEVHIYSSAANHAAGSSICTVTVLPFENLGSNTYQNIAGNPDHVHVTTEVKNIPVEIHGSALLCGSGTTSVYTGATTVKAYKDEAETGKPYKHGAQVTATVSG